VRGTGDGRILAVTTLVSSLAGAGLIVLALAGVDRLLLATEERGFVYSRRRRASPGSAASAALEMQRH